MEWDCINVVALVNGMVESSVPIVFSSFAFEYCMI
jgi:hypothetical protein